MRVHVLLFTSNIHEDSNTFAYAFIDALGDHCDFAHSESVLPRA